MKKTSRRTSGSRKRSPARPARKAAPRATPHAQALIDSNAGRPGLPDEPPPAAQNGTAASHTPPSPAYNSSGSALHRPVATASSPGREQATLPFHLEAWMPERIAIMKLRGFVHDAGGEVVESVPGLIKVRLGGRKSQSGGGPLAWLGLGRRSSSGPIDVELHLHHADPKQENRLTVHVLFRPSHPRLLADKVWRQRCGQIFVELRSYLMGSVSE